MTKDELIAEIEKLRISELRYRTLLDHSSDAIFSFNREGQYLYVNREFSTNVCGKEPDFVIGKKIWDLFSKEEADKRFAIVQWVFDNGESRNIEVRVPTPHGDTYHLTTVKPIFDDHNKVAFIICISKEITDRKIMEEQLKHSAHHDSLTKLPNRILFSEHLRHAIQQAERYHTRLALMYIDLDNFKPVNDTFGHDVGDRLLQMVAQRLGDCLRDSDSAGRIGGDEFVVLLPKINCQQSALNVAKKIRKSFQQPFLLQDHPAMHIAASIGVAIYPEHGCNEVELSKSADQAMYKAKERGRNRVTSPSILPVQAQES